MFIAVDVFLHRTYDVASLFPCCVYQTLIVAHACHAFDVLCLCAGPPGRHALLQFDDSRPTLANSTLGAEDGTRFAQVGTLILCSLVVTLRVFLGSCTPRKRDGLFSCAHFISAPDALSDHVSVLDIVPAADVCFLTCRCPLLWPQTPHIEFSDEGGTAVTSLQSRIYADNVQRVVNAWHTFGPIAGPSRLYNSTLKSRMWFQASTAIPESAYPGQPSGASAAASLFRSEVVFKVANTIHSMTLVDAGSTLPLVKDLRVIVAANATAAPVTLRPSDDNFTEWSALVSAGGWWIVWSPEPSQTQVFASRAHTVLVAVRRCPMNGCTSTWFTVSAPPALAVKQGDALTFELAQVAGSLLAPQVNTTADAMALRDYLWHPQGLTVARGHRIDEAWATGLIEIALDARGGAQLSVPQAGYPQAILPLRFAVQSPLWTVGLWQHAGWTIGHYGGGANRWTALGVSTDGYAHAPLYTGLAATNVSIGHPVTTNSPVLVIQVTCVKTTSSTTATAKSVANGIVWHVSVNNPTNATVVASLFKALPIPGLNVPDSQVTVNAGDWLVLPQL